EPNGADLGFREHCRWDIGVVDGNRLSAEHGVGKSMALANGDGGEINPVGHVADGIDAPDGAARECIDVNAAILGDPDAGTFKPDTGNIRPPSGREHDAIDHERAAV